MKDIQRISVHWLYEAKIIYLLLSYICILSICKYIINILDLILFQKRQDLLVE